MDFESNTDCGVVTAELDCSQRPLAEGEEESCGFVGGRVETCVLTAIAQRRAVEFSHQTPGETIDVGSYRDYAVSPSGESRLVERAVDGACTEDNVYAAGPVSLGDCTTMRCVLAALESAPVTEVCVDRLVICDE